MRYSTRMVLGVVAAAAMLLSACGSSSEPGDTESAGPIQIGYIGGLSGFSAAFSVPALDGVKFAIDEINKSGGINGRQIELTTVDDKGDPTASQTEMKRLISDGIGLIISGSSSAATLAHESVVIQNKVLAISPIASDPKVTSQQTGTPWYLVNVPNNTALGSTIAEYAATTMGLGSTAVFERDDAYGQTITDGFVGNVGAMSISSTTTYPVDRKDFSSDLVSALKSSPASVFLSGYAEDAGLIAKQARAAGFDGPLLGTNPMTAPQYSDIAGNAAANTYVSTSSAFLGSTERSDAQEQFVKAWTEAKGSEPNDYQVTAYDCVQVLKLAIEKTSSTDPATVRDYLLSMQPYDGASGQIGFDEHGASLRKIFVVRYENGTWKPVE